MGLALNAPGAARLAAARNLPAAPWLNAAAPLLPELLPEVQLHASAAEPQAALPLASQGVLRYVWHGRYGDMLIEVLDGQVYVNGSRVEPHVG